MPLFRFPWSRRKPVTLVADASSVFGVNEVGRQHIAGIPYMLPNDLQESDRLDFQHFLLRYALRGNFAAPLDAPATILDVGSGTGRWGRELAATFPAARVVGMDLTDSESKTEARPSNYEFVAGNVLEGLPFPDASFDYVHMRLLTAAIPAEAWPRALGELIRVTRPGGWVESAEAGPPTGGGPALDQILEWGQMMSRARGIDPAVIPHLGETMRALGLVDVTTNSVPIPMGKQGGRVGTLMATDFFAAMESMEGFYLRAGVCTSEQFHQTMSAARAATDAPDSRAATPFYIAYGRRPL